MTPISKVSYNRPTIQSKREHAQTTSFSVSTEHTKLESFEMDKYSKLEGLRVQLYNLLTKAPFSNLRKRDTILHKLFRLLYCPDNYIARREQQHTHRAITTKNLLHIPTGVIDIVHKDENPQRQSSLDMFDTDAMQSPVSMTVINDDNKSSYSQSSTCTKYSFPDTASSISCTAHKDAGSYKQDTMKDKHEDNINIDWFSMDSEDEDLLSYSSSDIEKNFSILKELLKNPEQRSNAQVVQGEDIEHLENMWKSLNSGSFDDPSILLLRLEFLLADLQTAIRIYPEMTCGKYQNDAFFDKVKVELQGFGICV
ncbi:meiotically upregulated Mug46 [Schizosaccharomyces cryophilus OY26]|uniref:Meiotically upregulated Mug46 n=1 Tax=Schizosaccharomyces cryophilus (strain OY26 / ATCC MYA-4695 / CBS 11777 / NBRC 106824 / NRRL Y48691) TaxID=653667 RepID=S9VV23_SCHCR|nr:meiotically upregulated Mug46 [Schizosaccharomyces cryophilus OY26]EPY50049.1 meiotically upregulated Mug46 [Schizosaccharomyces cryophilus OY26]